MKKPGSREKKPGFSALGGTRTSNLLIRSHSSQIVKFLVNILVRLSDISIFRLCF